MDARLKVEIVLNEDEENEEEKRFNEIICYDSGDSDGESNGFDQSDVRNILNVIRVVSVLLEYVKALV